MFPQQNYDSPVQLRKLFIGALSQAVTSDQIFRHFTKFGPVTDAVVMRDPDTKCSRGFGFVTFASILGTELAINHSPHVLGGKQIDLKRSIPRDQMMPPVKSTSPNFPLSFLNFDVKPGCKLLLTGINTESHTIEHLRAYFEIFGILEQVEVAGDNGFVVFKDEESAEKCLEHNGGSHNVYGEEIVVKKMEEE